MKDEGRGMRKIFLVFVILTFALHFSSTFISASDSEIRVGGYIRNFFIITDYDSDTAADALSRFRLKIDITPNESSSFEIAYELLPRLRKKNIDTVLAPVPGPALLSYRVWDFDEQLIPSNKSSNNDFILTHNLDRLYLTLSASSYDLYIGRQPVSFGSAHVISPTDIIAPFTYNTIAKEELTGVDALRFKKPLSDMGEFDLGLVFGENFEPDGSAGFVRLKTYQMKTDISVMAIVFKKNLLLGFDLARAIGGASAWLEAAEVFSEETSSENYFRMSVGADYSFISGLYTYIEYHFNGAGSGGSENYFNSITETAFTDGAVYLLGKHYIAPGITYEINPLLIFRAQALINMEDASALGSTGVEYSLAEDIYVDVGSYVGIGDKSSDVLRPKSEFGLYPDVYYAALNLYF